jgi:hypothetical protein
VSWNLDSGLYYYCLISLHTDYAKLVRKRDKELSKAGPGNVEVDSIPIDMNMVRASSQRGAGQAQNSGFVGSGSQQQSGYDISSPIAGSSPAHPGTAHMQPSMMASSSSSSQSASTHREKDYYTKTGQHMNDPYKTPHPAYSQSSYSTNQMQSAAEQPVFQWGQGSEKYNSINQDYSRLNNSDERCAP